jgi:Holliday junction resolvase RusA-like endonuclease
MKQSLEIPGQFPSLNEVIRMAKSHWSLYAREKKKMTESVAWMASALKSHERPVSVTFTWWEPNARRDVDNCRAIGCKSILDGLVMAQVIKSDGQKHVQQLRDFFYVDRENPRVLVTIEDL